MHVADLGSYKSLNTGEIDVSIYMSQDEGTIVHEAMAVDSSQAMQIQSGCPSGSSRKVVSLPTVASILNPVSPLSYHRSTEAASSIRTKMVISSSN